MDARTSSPAPRRSSPDADRTWREIAGAAGYVLVIIVIVLLLR